MATRPEISRRNKSLRAQSWVVLVAAIFLIAFSPRGFAESGDLFPNATIRCATTVFSA